MILSDPHVEALLRIMPATHGADEQVDWEAAEARLGTRLPADYRAFMAVYGGGSIGDLVSIELPLPPHDFPRWEGTIAQETENIRHHWEEYGGVPGVELGPDAVLAWGVGCPNGDLLGWLMRSSDPDQWPVVVYRRHVSWGEPPFALFECGMATFLTRMMRAEFDECPLSDVGLWGRVEPFVHWREQLRRRDAGLDPITAEPDPYAGMFG